jgi:hypothetical protein
VEKYKVNSLVLFVCYFTVLPRLCKVPANYIVVVAVVVDDIYLYLHMVLCEPVMTLLIFIIEALFN